jgi:DNA polymerase
MSESVKDLAAAAKQLMDGDAILGGEFVPRGGTQLPGAPAVAAAGISSSHASAPAGTAAGRSGTPARPTAPGARATTPPPRPAGPPAIAPTPAPSDGSIPLPLGANMTPEQKRQALDALNAEHVAKCAACVLSKTRKNIVFGEGNAAAQLVFVGEAPGEDEDLSGRPFVGKAGQLLEKMIVAMGLTRQDVFICNVLKCRPPGNRPPAPDESLACSPYLIRQLEILAPKVIVTLGNPATQTLLRTREGITRLRGNWQTLPAHAPGLGGIPVMPTFHPSYVLRSYTPEVRGMVWGDLQKVMERLGLKKP